MNHVHMQFVLTDRSEWTEYSVHSAPTVRLAVSPLRRERAIETDITITDGLRGDAYIDIMQACAERVISSTLTAWRLGGGV